MLTEIPTWAAKHRKPGIEVQRRRNNYYAYRIRSVYDATKKRSRKVTVEYLGKITQDGILPPKHKRPKKVTSVLETGNIIFLNRFAKTLVRPLKEFWPESYQSILAAGVLKLAYLDPLKRLQFRYETSIANRLWPDAHLSKNSITKLLESLGRDWGSQRSFFEEISKSESNMAIDLTQIFSESLNISWLEKGYNAHGISHDQLQLLLIWGLDTHLPGFLKLLPGTASSAQNLVNSIRESRLENVIVVGDKAFFSEDNVTELERYDVHYALSLRRDLPFLQYPSVTRYTKYFVYRKSIQWWREYEWCNRRIVHYLDKQIAAEEESAFLRRVEEKKASISEYRSIRRRFGTLAILTDTGLFPKPLYELYKQRREIESSFDALKNTLEGDKTWMQSREKLQGYFFILFIALHLYSQALEHLRCKDLLKKYSVHDVLWGLSKVYMVTVDGQDIVGEITKSTRELITRLEVPITQNLGS